MNIKPSRISRTNHNRNRFYLPDHERDVFLSRNNQDSYEKVVNVSRDYVAEKPVMQGQAVTIIGLEKPIKAVVIECKNPSSILVVDKQEFFHQVSFSDKLDNGTVYVRIIGSVSAKAKAGFCSNKQHKMDLSLIQKTFLRQV